MTSAKRSIARLLSAFLLAAPLSAYAIDQSATSAPAVHHKSHKKPAPFILPPLPAGPLRQVPMDQLPAAPPIVTYQNGLLSIAAQNATLGEILRDVRKLTGASIDIPQNANDRVVTQLGPGAPRDVLAQLLNGTSFNYVMAGSASDPNAVASVILSSKPSAGGEVQAAANTPPAFQPVQQPVMPGGLQPPQPFRQQMMPPGAQPQPAAGAAADADDNSDDADADDKDDETDATQPVQPGPVMVQDGNAVLQGSGQVDPNQPNAGPKSPEQILQMMRQGPPGQPGAPGPGPMNGPPPNE
jgi:hypothetical protein